MADPKFDGYAKADLTKKLVDGETGGVTFNGLTPASDYDFVAAYAGQDPTKFGTDLGKVTTPQVVPTAPTIKVTAGDSQATAVVTPSANADKEAITGYNFYVKNRTDNWPAEATLSTTPDKLTVTIPNLTNGNEYTIGVTAVNSAGESDYNKTGASDHVTPVVTPLVASPENVNVEVGQTATTNISPVPTNGGTFSVKDTTIATVDYKLNGRFDLTGVKAGNTELDVTNPNETEQTIAVPITVTAPASSASSAGSSAASSASGSSSAAAPASSAAAPASSAAK